MKDRVGLWLRSERAMGLHALPVRRMSLPAAPTVAAPRSPAPAPKTALVPSPARPPASALEMFAGAEDGPFDAPLLPRTDRISQLDLLNRNQVSNCQRCRLCEQRTHTVFGEGDPEATIFFIGEGPGETEDQTGRPFVGRAGQKLDEMIGAMGLRRDQVFIANVVKCRPPDNRTPVQDEIDACTPYLLRQLEIVRPKVIVTLGLPATRYMLKSSLSMGRMRGQWHQWRGIKLMPTFHPAYILRNYTTETRRQVWSDLQMVMAELGLKGKQSGSAEPRNSSE